MSCNPELEFILGGTRVVMNPGQVWYHNFNLPHSVANKGRIDRIHLVIGRCPSLIIS